jgi:hypothetical protein
MFTENIGDINMYNASENYLIINGTYKVRIYTNNEEPKFIIIYYDDNNTPNDIIITDDKLNVLEDEYF